MPASAAARRLPDQGGEECGFEPPGRELNPLSKSVGARSQAYGTVHEVDRVSVNGQSRTWADSGN